MKLSTKAQKSLNQVIDRFKAGDLSPLVEVARIRRHPEDHRPFDAWSLSTFAREWATSFRLRWATRRAGDSVTPRE